MRHSWEVGTSACIGEAQGSVFRSDESHPYWYVHDFPQSLKVLKEDIK
jgi:hypothetical protein